MKKFDHINIVKFIELMTTKRSLYIITEMCMDGDLKRLLIRKKLSEQEVMNIMAQIVNGFKEMVAHGVIHRDLKPANILNHKGIVKLGGTPCHSLPLRFRVREVRRALLLANAPVLRRKSSLYGSTDSSKEALHDEMRHLVPGSDLLRNAVPPRPLEGQGRG